MQGEGNAPTPHWRGLFQPTFNNRHLCRPGAPQEDGHLRPQCHGPRGTLLPPAQVSPMPRAEPAAPAFLADPTPTSHLPAARTINTSRPSTARGQAALPLPDGTSRGGRLAGCWRRRTSRAGGRPGRRGLLPQPLHLAGPACQTRPPVA